MLSLTTVLLLVAVASVVLLFFISGAQDRILGAPILAKISPAQKQLSEDKDRVVVEKDKTDMTYPPPLEIDWTAVKQPYDAYLVLDVEATCMPGTDFNYANEIIEWPVCLLRWKYKDEKGKASRLEIVDEFRSFVKPVWRPRLSSFCTALTGITQTDVDAAPQFSTLVYTSFRNFLTRNGLIDAETGVPLVRFCWCSDGPWDIRDFVVKQCFMSKISLPPWLAGDVLDVRRVVARWQERNDTAKKAKSQSLFPQSRGTFLPITRQLEVLGLGAFEGRQHCGIDDTRNVARIVIELARRGMLLKPNTAINPHRRWPWMGRNGKVLEEYVAPFSSAL
ncbi:hypothetical protein BDW22DRAFT_1360017 [Trametopsis cervina]|nr:hypothetical protein BDW22DRAFT_1360017 [Trametopsis cervina]